MKDANPGAIHRMLQRHRPALLFLRAHYPLQPTERICVVQVILPFTDLPHIKVPHTSWPHTNLDYDRFITQQKSYICIQPHFCLLTNICAGHPCWAGAHVRCALTYIPAQRCNVLLRSCGSTCSHLVEKLVHSGCEEWRPW